MAIDCDAEGKRVVSNLSIENRDDFTDNPNLQPVSNKSTPLISYEIFVWTIFLATTTLAIIDRFTTNYWPRQAFTIGNGSAGNDRLVGLKPGPWSVAAYDIIARVSGRFSILCFNLLLIVRFRWLEHALQCSPFANQLLDCRSIMKANIRLHRWNAIALCVLTVVHVWSILLPCIAHGYEAQIIAGYFEYPISERTPPGFKDADPNHEVMSLQIDDVWRIVEMTVLLCILIPLSVRWLVTRWHIGMPLHRLIMVLYFVDIVRRHSHPHSWVLNTPIFLLYIIDKIWFWYSNCSVSPPIHRVHLGYEYMVLLWRHPQRSTANSIVAADYHLRLNDSSMLESSHVFSVFENRGQKLALKENVPFDWTVGTVVHVMHNKRTPKLGKKDPISHTARMAEVESLDVSSWGAYHSEMSAHLRHALLEFSDTPVILIGAGSGVGFIIDVLQWKDKYAYNTPVKILFSTRTKELFDWAQWTMQPFACNTNNQVIFALTGEHNKKYSEVSSNTVQEGDNDLILIQHHHFRFEENIDSGSIVFCQGSRKMNDFVAKACELRNARFIGGLQSPERIEIIDALRDSIHGVVHKLSLSRHNRDELEEEEQQQQ